MTDSKILLEDFAEIAGEYDFSALRGSSVLVTGATGLIGSQLLQFLLYLNETQGYGMRLCGLVRPASLEKAARVFGADAGKITLVQGDVLNLPQIGFGIDYIIHGASVTSSKDFISRAVETIDIAVNGTKNMLGLAREKRVRSFLYLSSMEAFGITGGAGEVREADLGCIDILSPRSSYSEGKRMCECLCACLCACHAEEYGTPAKIVRLTQTLGAGIDYGDTRVAAQFARAAIEGHDIVLRTKGATRRPVLYTRDAISAILTVLLRGRAGEAYTAANPATLATIRETAELVARKVADGAIKVAFDIQGVPGEYAPNLNLNVDKLRALGWKPEVGLEEAYRRMIAGMRKSRLPGQPRQ